MYEIEIALIGFTVSLIGTAFGIRQERRFSGLERRIAQLETKIEPFWEVIRKCIPQLLTRKKNPSSEILNLLQERNLTQAQIDHIKAELEAECNRVPLSQRANFVLVLAYLETLKGGRSGKGTNPSR